MPGISVPRIAIPFKGKGGINYAAYWATLNESLVGYWKLDEASGNAINSVNSGTNDGVNTLVTQAVTGKINTGYSFVRADLSHTYMGAIGPLNDYSISIWAKRTDWGVGGQAFPFGITNAAGGPLFTGSTGSPRLRGAVGNICSWKLAIPDDGKFHHIVLTISVTNSRAGIYIDRNWVDKFTVACEPLQNITLAGTYSAGAFNTAYPWGGSLDEVALFNKEITPDEVAKLFNRGEGIQSPFEDSPHLAVCFYGMVLYYTYIMASRGDKMVVWDVATSKLRYSGDNGYSFGTGIDISALSFTIDFGKVRILNNGVIVLFGGKTALYYSDDNLATINACTVLDKNGDPFVFHIPANASYPGAYFNFMSGFQEHNGVCLAGNYCNAGTVGAAPVIIWYSLDGITWKECYQFGQNPSFTDVGTATYGLAGTLLGDAANSILCRHVHAINIGDDGNFYLCTGDNANENHIFKFVYSAGLDSWTITELTNTTSDGWQRMRALGAFLYNGYLYWGSDGAAGNDNVGGINYSTQGVFRCSIDEINDITKHERILDVGDAVYSFLNINNLVLVSTQTGDKIFISENNGVTFSEHEVPVSLRFDGAYGVYNETYKTFITKHMIHADLRGLLGV